MNRRKSIIQNALVFVLLITISYFGSTTYRSYIYSNHLYDFHIADSFPSFMSIPVAYSFWLLINKINNKYNINKYKILFSSLIGFIVYEFLEIFGVGFDFFDIIATLLGFFITVLFIYDFKKIKF